MRHRIEDLGRITVLIKILLDHQLFEDRPCRSKDYSEWFEQQKEEKKDEILHAWVYGIDDLKEKLYEMLEIAEGRDPLNETIDEQK